LLEAHRECGKRWADIAKRLSNRTENTVKNRFNSLIKRYKNEMSSDGLSEISGDTNGTMDDIERRIADMILEDRKKEYSEQTTPNRMSEIPEEDDLSMDGMGDDDKSGRFKR